MRKMSSRRRCTVIYFGKSHLETDIDEIRVGNFFMHTTALDFLDIKDLRKKKYKRPTKVVKAKSKTRALIVSFFTSLGHNKNAIYPPLQNELFKS